MSKTGLKQWFLIPMIAFALFFGINCATNDVLVPVNKVSAVVGSAGQGESNAQVRLRDAIDSAVAGNKYTTVDGDTVQGSTLVKNGMVVESKVELLDSKSKQKLVQDILDATNKQKELDKENDVDNAVTNTVVQQYVKTLQNKGGVGALLVAELTKDIKADMVGGTQVISPIIPIINIAIGMFVILATMMIVFTSAIDIFAIAFPPFQKKVLESGSNEKGIAKFVGGCVSPEARCSIEAANESGAGAGAYVWKYIKGRAVVYVLIVIAIYLLVTGTMWDITGMIVNGIDGIWVNLRG